MAGLEDENVRRVMDMLNKEMGEAMSGFLHKKVDIPHITATVQSMLARTVPDNADRIKVKCSPVAHDPGQLLIEPDNLYTLIIMGGLDVPPPYLAEDAEEWESEDVVYKFARVKGEVGEIVNYSSNYKEANTRITFEGTFDPEVLKKLNQK